MQTNLKQQIREKLDTYIKAKGSQNKAANSLEVSPALLSQIMNENWDLISEDMWRNISAKIGFNKTNREIVTTTDFQMITALLNDAQENANVFAVVGSAGSGKTVALKQYAADNKNAFLVCCNEFWNRKLFLCEIMRVMGKDPSGYTVGELMSEVVRYLKSAEAPVLILDEADKLTDQVLYFFITLYNMLEDHCGIVMVATNYLQKRIEKGVKTNRKGHNEIYSRIGRKFIQLRGVGYTDVVQICTANGLTDQKQIKTVFDDCEGDLRRVIRKIHAIKSKKNDD